MHHKNTLGRELFYSTWETWSALVVAVVGQRRQQVQVVKVQVVMVVETEQEMEQEMEMEQQVERSILQ